MVLLFHTSIDIIAKHTPKVSIFKGKYSFLNSSMQQNVQLSYQFYNVYIFILNRFKPCLEWWFKRRIVQIKFTNLFTLTTWT